MRKIIYVFLIILSISMSFSLIGCGDSLNGDVHIPPVGEYDPNYNLPTNNIPTPTVLLGTPVVSIDKNGVASWVAVDNAVKYVYVINDGVEVETANLSAVLNANDTIKVKAISDGVRYLNSNFSEVVKFDVHIHSYIESVSKEPTCTTNGEKSFVCECGDKHYESIPMLGHNFVEYKSNNDATCESDGTETAKCVRCDVTDTRTDLESKLEHTITSYPGKPATCTEDGYKAYDECSECEYNTYESISALGHDYDSLVTNPTCTEEGFTTHTCSVCSNAYTDSKVDALGHDWTDATCTEAKKCLVCDITEGEKLDHKYESEVTEPTCSKSGYTTHTCKLCQDSYVDSRVSALGHTWNDATCTEEKTCSVCGSTEGEPLGHKYESIVSNPTCTLDGYTTHTCKVCNHEYTDSKVAALGHDWNDATCTEAKTCSVCNTTEGESLGHDWKNATCTEAKTCSVCNITEGVKLGHDYESVVSNPTCTLEGYTTHTCNRCDDSYIDSKVAALGHTWNDATCTEAKTCSVCNATEGESLGHDYESVVTAPTCTLDGYTTHTCNRCDDSYTDSKVATLGHTASEAVKENIVNSTCTNAGSYDLVIYCSVCEAEIRRTNVDLELAEHSYSEQWLSDKLKHWHKCENCDAITEKLDHDWDAGVEELAPTEEKEGIMLYTCDTCGNTKTIEIPELSHEHTYSDTLSFDEYYHWYAATCKHTNEVKDKELHTLENEHYLVIDKVLYTALECECGYLYKKEVNTLEAILVSTEEELIYLLTNGFSVKLAEDIEITSVAEICIIGEDIDLTIDMNNKTIKNTYLNEKISGGVLYVADGATVTITGNGSMYSTNGSNSDYVVCALDGATVNIMDGYYYSYGCTAIYARTNSIINIYGGKYEIKEYYYGVSYLLDIWEGEEENQWAKINVYAGEFVDFNPANHGNDTEKYTNKLVEGKHSLFNEETNIYTVSDHKYTSVVTAPTCTEDGYTTYTCICEYSYIGSPVDALGHDEEEHEGLAATCEDAGFNAYVTCSRCDYNTYETIDALGHEYESVVTAPTCTEKGYTTHTCKNDSTHTYVDTYVDVKDHSWDEGVETKAPSTTEKGELTFTCESCGNTRVEEIPMIIPTEFTVKFVNWDDSELLTVTVEKGKTAVYTGENPTRESEKDYLTYSFIGWDKELTNISENLVVKALFELKDTRPALETTYGVISYEEIFALIPEEGNKTSDYEVTAMKKAYFIGYLKDLIINESSVSIILEDQNGNIITSKNALYIFNDDLRAEEYTYLFSEGDVIVVYGNYENISGEIYVTTTWIKQINTKITNTLPEYSVPNTKENLKLNPSYTEDFPLITEKNDCLIIWESDSNSIVIDGSTAKVTRGEQDVTVTLTATIKNGEITTTKTFTITIPKIVTTPGTSITKITSVDQLKDGLKILLTCNNYVCLTYTSGGSCPTINSGIDLNNSSNLNIIDDMEVFTLVKNSDNTWSIKLENGKYLSYGTNTNVKTVTSIDDKAKWTITITDGVAEVQNVGDNSRYLQFSTSSNVFKAYKSDKNPTLFIVNE